MTNRSKLVSRLYLSTPTPCPAGWFPYRLTVDTCTGPHTTVTLSARVDGGEESKIDIDRQQTKQLIAFLQAALSGRDGET